MRFAVALALCFASVLAPGLSVAAQAHPAPMVLVVDGAAGRLSVVRLRRALASVLARPVVRVTDPEASSAPLRLTVAFSAPRSWTVLIEGNGHRDTRAMEVRGPALETLVGVAVDMVRACEGGTASAERAEPPIAVSLAHPWTGSVALANEILDPFAGMPVSRVVIAAVSDLLDPFTAVGAAVRVARSPEVLDPWR